MCRSPCRWLCRSPCRWLCRSYIRAAATPKPGRPLGRPRGREAVRAAVRPAAATPKPGRPLGRPRGRPCGCPRGRLRLRWGGWGLVACSCTGFGCGGKCRGADGGREGSAAMAAPRGDRPAAEARRNADRIRDGRARKAERRKRGRRQRDAKDRNGAPAPREPSGEQQRPKARPAPQREKADEERKAAARQTQRASASSAAERNDRPSDKPRGAPPAPAGRVGMLNFHKIDLLPFPFPCPCHCHCHFSFQPYLCPRTTPKTPSLCP